MKRKGKLVINTRIAIVKVKTTIMVQASHHPRNTETHMKSFTGKARNINMAQRNRIRRTIVIKQISMIVDIPSLMISTRKRKITNTNVITKGFSLKNKIAFSLFILQC